MAEPEIYKLSGLPLAQALAATPITYKGEPVLTFAAIDLMHERPESTARQSFMRNRKRFVEGKHFVRVPAEVLKSSHCMFRVRGSGAPARDMIVFTKRGYTMLVKPFGDDLAWAVQEELSESYWTRREDHEALELRSALNELRSDMRANRARTDLLLDFVDGLTREEAGDGARAMNRRKQLKRLTDSLREPVLEIGRPEFWIEGDDPAQVYMQFEDEAPEPRLEDCERRPRPRLNGGDDPLPVASN